MQIRKLCESTRSLMRSSFILTDFNSIVDELIANALDAHATGIEISINLDTFCLTICDNGDGITFENMQNIGQRHHTSKQVNDTMRGITSLGYKGEALCSLSQISMLQIISKNRYNHNICSKLMRGAKLISIQNNIKTVKSHSYLENKTNGTIIIVKDIFFNLQIRRKEIFGAKNDKKTFKKTAISLQSNLIKWAVAHYDIQFILNHCDKKVNKVICKSKGYSSPKFVLSSLIDPHLIKYLYTFDSDDFSQNRNNINFDENVRIWGVICDAQRLYHKKNWQFIFLNKRCIQHNKIYQNIIDLLMKINKCFKYDDVMNLNINSSSNTNINSRVPWYSHKANKHHKYPIFAIFLETNPRNIVMENDTKKLHVLIKNEEEVLKMLQYTLLCVAYKLYPSLKFMNEWKDAFSQIIDIEVNDNNTCGDIIRDELQENEEKLVCEDITKGNDIDIEQEHELTAPLHECSVLSTPSTSPSDPALVSESPSPPWQITKRKQRELHLWSVQRKKKKKRKLSEIDNGDIIINNENRHKKQKLVSEYFDDDLDELISTNTNTFFNDYFPAIPQNVNKITSKESQSVIIANQQSNDLMDAVLLNANREHLFGFNLPDFKGLDANPTGTAMGETNNKCHGTKHIMDIIEGEIKLSSILKEWREKCLHCNNSEKKEIPIHNIGTNDIVISKKDLCLLKLFGIGQIDKKWIITKLKKKQTGIGVIILVDQHAADERVRVERLASFLCGDKGPNSFRIQTTKLSDPYEIFVEYQEFEALNKNCAWIKKWGFQYEILTSNDAKNNCKIKVFQTPLIYGSKISVDELRELLHNISIMDVGVIQSYIPKCVRRVLASKACRSAIKFGDALNEKEMRNLLSALSKCKLPFQCAHGRPTLFPIADLMQLKYDKNLNLIQNKNIHQN